MGLSPVLRLILSVWPKSFIFRLRIIVYISRPLKILCDNSTALFMAKNNKSESQTNISTLSTYPLEKELKIKEWSLSTLAVT